MRATQAVTRKAESSPPRVPPIVVDRELVRKYDASGPRYTSYPTAPNFHPFGPEDYERLLAASAVGGQNLSLYVHLPFCRTLCFYCGCNVTISRHLGRGREYLGAVRREIEMAAERLAAERPREVVQIHFGGGTPNFFPPEDLQGLIDDLRRRFRLHPGCEIGIEVDPRTMTPEHLDAFAAAGVNRLSAGVQDLDPEVQKAINRLQPAELTARVIDGAHRRGIESVNVDLIYGLPHQTVETFAQTLDGAIAMGPERFAVFNFAYLPQMLRHQRVIDPAALPSAEEKLSILEITFRKLTDAGYVPIGMDHFARPDDPLARALANRSLTRNFQGYSTWGETDLVAFGASAIGFLGGGFAQNLKTADEFQKALGSGRFATCKGYVLDAEDRLRRHVILELMCHLRLDFEAVGRRFGVEARSHFGAELEALAPLADDGLIEIHDQGIEVLPPGHLLVRNVAMAFDAHLAESRRRVEFSRTV